MPTDATMRFLIDIERLQTESARLHRSAHLREKPELFKGIILNNASFYYQTDDKDESYYLCALLNASVAAFTCQQMMRIKLDENLPQSLCANIRSEPTRRLCCCALRRLTATDCTDSGRNLPS